MSLNPIFNSISKLLFILVIISALLSCSNDVSDSESQAWVRIDEPNDGAVTTSDSIYIKGNAGMRDGSYPGTVYWTSNTGSGVARQQVICILACITAWDATVPLMLGDNTITVTMLDGIDQVGVTRFTYVTVNGKITMNDIDGPLVLDVPVNIRGNENNITVTTDAGQYSYPYIRAGTYTINPLSLPLPQSSACIDSYIPSSREITVLENNTSDIYGQDFIAVEGTPCYYISGSIVPSTNPTGGMSDIKVTLTDQYGNEMIDYSNASGYYSFHNFEPGTYTITPSDCDYLGNCQTFTPSFIEVTISGSDVTGQDFIREF